MLAPALQELAGGPGQGLAQEPARSREVPHRNLHSRSRRTRTHGDGAVDADFEVVD